MEETQFQTQLPSQESISQLPSKKPIKLVIKIIIGIIILVVLGFVISLYTRAFDPLWNPFRPEPEEVIDKMALEMGKLKTSHSKIDLAITGENEGGFEFTLKTEGNTDNTEPENPKLDGKFDITFSVTGAESPIGGKFALGGDIKTISEVSYLKITTLPIIPFLDTYLGIDFSQIKDQWIKIDPESITNFMKEMAGQEWTPEMEKMLEESLEKQKTLQKELQQELKGVLTGRKVYLVKKELPDEKIGGTKFYHYVVSLNQVEVKKMIPEIWKVLEAVIIKEYGIAPTFNEAKFQEELDKFFNKLGEISGEIWIGEKDFYLYKIKGEKTVELSKFEKGAKGEITIKMNIEFSNFDQPVKIEAPAEYKTIEEILAPLIEKMKEEYYWPEYEEELPRGVLSADYELFSKEIAYRGNASPGYEENAHLPIRYLYLPATAKIYKIETTLEAYNRDPQYPRSAGIAVGYKIPEDCQSAYYFTLGSQVTREGSFALNPSLFRTGNNLITAWISTYGEWGGNESWVSLKMKIYYTGGKPQLLEGVSIIEKAVDPIMCKSK